MNLRNMAVPVILTVANLCVAVLVEALPRDPDQVRIEASSLDAQGDAAGAARLLELFLAQAPAAEHAARAAAGNDLARLRFTLGEYEAALRAAATAAEDAETVGDHGAQAFAEFMVGMVHRQLQQHDEAIAAFRASARLAQDAGETEHWLRALNEESNVMMQQGDLEGALARKLEGLRVAGTNAEPATLVSLENDLACALLFLERPTDALPHFQRAWQLSREAGLTREAAVGALNISSTLATLDDLEGARTWARRGLQLASEQDLLAERRLAHATLGGLLAASGDFEAAVEHLQSASELQERLMTEESARRIAELGSRHDAQRRQAEIELLRRDAEIRSLELERAKTLRRLLLAGVVGLVAFVSVLGAAYRVKVQANRKIQAANRELDAARLRVEELARTDALTGLANRRAIEERLAEEALRSARSQHPFAVVLADLDHFKRVNDAFGHEVGDAVLQEVARRLRSQVRTVDLAGRWGGEEFLLVLPGTDAEGARQLAEKLRLAVSRDPVLSAGIPLEVTVTLGIAEHGGDPVEATVRRADEALYRGKKEGRDRVVAA